MIGKRMVAIALVGIGMMGIGGCQHNTQINIDNIYPQYSVVVSIDKERDIVTVECNDTKYEMRGVEDWEEGDKCSLLMDTNGTDVVSDDTIIKAEYDGYEW